MTTMEAANRAFLTTLFEVLATEGWGQGFLDALRDDVVFNAMGSSPIAGRYEGKELYRTTVLNKLHGRLAIRPRLELLLIMVDGDMACARFQSRGGKGNNGADFSTDYCWVFKLKDQKIKEIWGYYDTGKMVDLFEEQNLHM